MAESYIYILLSVHQTSCQKTGAQLELLSCGLTDLIYFDIIDMHRGVTSLDYLLFVYPKKYILSLLALFMIPSVLKHANGHNSLHIKTVITTCTAATLECCSQAFLRKQLIIFFRANGFSRLRNMYL